MNTTTTGNAADVDLSGEHFTPAELDEIKELALAAPKVWYGTCQIAAGISDESAVALMEACSPATVLDLIAMAHAARQHPTTLLAGSGAQVLLNADELTALRRFDECAQDGEGYDVPKAMMQRLAEIGVVQRRSSNYYQATEFGQRVLGQPLTSTAAPVEMILHCPACGLQHVDAPDFEDDPSMLAAGIVHKAYDGWTNPPHRSHLCHGCGHIWRPADVPTNGVKTIATAGKNDGPVSSTATTQPSQCRALREVHKQQADPKLATTGATAYARFLHAELARLQAAVIADDATSDQAGEPSIADRIRALQAAIDVETSMQIRCALEDELNDAYAAFTPRASQAAEQAGE